MLHPEEIIELSEYLKRQEFQSSPNQIFAAQQVLYSEAARNSGAGSLVRLSSLLGPIFCRTPEEQHKFEELYLQWLRQRSGRPNTIPSTPIRPGPGTEILTSHWRMKVLGVALLILPILTAWFLWQDLRLRHVIGHVMAEGNPVSQAMVRLGEQTDTTNKNGEFQFPFQAKNMPMELAVEMKGYLPSSTPIGQSIKTNRNWFYLYPLDWDDQLKIGEILLSKEEPPPVLPEPPTIQSTQLPQSKMTLEKFATLKSPIPPWWARLNYYILIGVLAPVLLVLGWLLYRHSRRGRLQRQSSRIPPKLKHVQVQAGTQHIFPSLSLRHITQRLRQTRFVESTELDVHRTIQCTMERGGLFTPVYGSMHEPGYVALIDRATMADHQAHLAAQLVKDLARGYVLVRQYEFDEQPIMLRSVDPLRPSPKHGAGGTALATAVEVVPLEEVQAKFPAGRLLCFVDPITCFDPLTGKLHPWVETLEAWKERFLLTTTPDGHWGQAERILSRRGFQVIPLSLLGLRLFSTLLEQGSVFGAQQSPIPGTTNFHDRMPERWLERHPPSPEFIQRLLADLEQAFSQEKEGANAERGKQGMLWLAGCAAYPEIHWALTLEWGVRLIGHGSTAETLLPKLTRLVWFRHAFMPDWFRKALYDRLAGSEADRISQELSEILGAVNPENREGLQLHIATQPEKKAEPVSPIGPVRAWFRRLARKLKLQAMGQAAEPGSPMADYVMLQYLSGKQGKALTPYAPKALLRFLFPKGQPWLGFRPEFLMVAAVLMSGGLWWSLDPIPVPLPSPIQAVALSQDGTRLAVGREDGRLQVWDWKTKQMVVDLPEKQAPITSLGLSVDGNRGATGFQDGSIRLWDGTTGAETTTINGSNIPIVSLAFNAVGGKLALGTARAKTVLTLTKSGLAESIDSADFSGKFQDFSLTNLPEEINTLSFSPDGLVLAIGKKGGSIFLLPRATKPMRKLTSQAGELLSLAWDPTGTFLMSYSEEGTVRIWHQETRQLVSQGQIRASEIGSLSWPTATEAWVAILGAEGPEVWRMQIPDEFLHSSNLIPKENLQNQDKLGKGDESLKRRLPDILSEPLIKLGTLPPENADGPLRYWSAFKKYFLVIVVNQTDVANTDLPFTQVDGRSIVSSLTRLGYLPLDPAHPLLTGPQATASAILATIKEAGQKEEEASLVVYYTGHGAVGTKDLWLQTAGQVKVGDGQGVKFSDLIVQARHTTTQNGFEGELVLILDACYSGKGKVSQGLTLGDLGQHTTILTSSAEIQESFSLDHPEYPRMSAFTYTLLQGMGPDWANADSDGDGILRWEELKQYASRQLRDLYDRKALPHLMTPSMLTNYSEGFLAYKREQVRVWRSSYRDNLTTKEMDDILAALRFDEAALGPNHPDVARDLNNLAALYEAQGKYAEAEPLYQRALAINEQALGLSHPDVAMSLKNLANLYQDQGKYAEAEPLYQRALQIFEVALGADHPNVVAILKHLADLYRAQGKNTEAQVLEERMKKAEVKKKAEAGVPKKSKIAQRLDKVGDVVAEAKTMQKQEEITNSPNKPFQQQEMHEAVPQQSVQQIEKRPSRITGKDGATMVLVPAGEDLKDEINRYFAQSGLTPLAVPRTDVQPGTLILTRGKEAFLGDHILDYVDREADPDHDYGTFGGSAKDEVDAVLRPFNSQTKLSAETALEFLVSVFRLSPGVDVGLSGTVKIGMPDAKVRKMKVASLEKFLTRKDSLLFRTQVRDWAKRGLNTYVAYEVFQAKSLTIVATEGEDVSPSLKVGAAVNLPVEVEGSVAYKKTAGNELTVSGDRYVAFAVKTAKLLPGTTDDAVLVDRTQFVKPIQPIK